MSLARLSIKGISYSQTQNGAYALLLSDMDSDRQLPIVIGAFEAQSIAIALEKEIKPPRPLTHDLFKTFSDRFQISIKQVIIHKLVDGIFYSSLICERDGIEETIDARTSDAIALALRFDAPIFTYKNILDKAGIFLSDKNQDADIYSSENLEKTEDIKDERKSSFKNEFSQMTTKKLNELLDKAVNDEDYERAAKIRDEISKRS
ncbi:bifunctional nuclease family protein [Psychroflexus lacisalsi]|jgi:bifunctional DNase/RNase|uniref:Bifunctional nuclease family protein n=1 Tax=Psychroflexus lacisalsi TaxID=503928 RepID=A0ABP3VRV7_9FLAO|nr:bifunctional nuclease family protein [Psychroflexus lacisalsi]MBZ9620322.1 bifunctional nuclease family protein [Psychroflexus lacisalsi]